MREKSGWKSSRLHASMARFMKSFIELIILNNIMLTCCYDNNQS